MFQSCGEIVCHDSHHHWPRVPSAHQASMNTRVTCYTCLNYFHVLEQSRRPPLSAGWIQGNPDGGLQGTS